MGDNAHTVVYVVRHGEAENPQGIIYGRMAGFPLSNNGQQMAKLTAAHLQEADIRQAVSSPLTRAMQTAEPIAATHGVTVDMDERLLEPWNRFEGQRFAVGDGALRHPRAWWWLRDPFSPSWGEPYRQVAMRMRAVLFELAADVRGGAGVMVSHQLSIEVLRRSILGHRLWHNPRNRMVTLASVTAFVFDGDEVVAVEYTEPALELVPTYLHARVRMTRRELR